MVARNDEEALFFGDHDGPMARASRRWLPWWRGPRAGRSERGRVPDHRRADVPGVVRLWRWHSLHRRSLLCEPSRLSVHRSGGLRELRPLHPRSVLRQPRRKPLLGPEPLRGSSALHGRHVLRQRERLALHREQRVRCRVGVCRRPMQLTQRSHACGRSLAMLWTGKSTVRTSPSAIFRS
jgi:hypothetical protein